MMRLGIDTHLVTSHFALPLLIRQQGLVVEMTDGTAEYNQANYRLASLLRPGEDVGAAHRLGPARSWPRTAPPPSR